MEPLSIADGAFPEPIMLSPAAAMVMPQCQESLL
jgi:hypothetical protein